MPTQNKWAAVTGTSGFVGGYIALALKNAGYNVLSLDLVAPKAAVDRHISIDISDSGQMTRVSADIPPLRCVIHCAASRAQDESAITANVLGTYNVLKFLGQHTGNICNISSVLLIGAPERAVINEQHPVRPQSLYHLSKYQAELLCGLPEFQGLNIKTLRFASPNGPGMPGGLILSLFIANSLRNAPIRINGKGARVMNYIDTRDIANAVVCAVERPDVSGLFLLKGTAISNIDLARLCVGVTNSKAPIEFSGIDDPQDAHRWIIDGSKAEKLLGFTARIPLEQTIRDIAESLR